MQNLAHSRYSTDANCITLTYKYNLKNATFIRLTGLFLSRQSFNPSPQHDEKFYHNYYFCEQKWLIYDICREPNTVKSRCDTDKL